MKEYFKALNNLFEKISPVYDQLGTENLWWRGQPEQGLNLIPYVFRRMHATKSELEMVLNFERQAPLRYAAWPHERSLQLLLMQHFGLPTRLMDWSLGVLTALYFAVGDEREGKSASLWALNPVKLNKRMTGKDSIGVLKHDEHKVQELVDMAFARYSERSDPGDLVLAMSGPELDLRMLVQWGAYTIHANDKPIEELPNCSDFAVEIIIPAADRQPLRHALRIAGFSHSRLFPDLQSLAEDLRNIYKY